MKQMHILSFLMIFFLLSSCKGNDVDSVETPIVVETTLKTQSLTIEQEIDGSMVSRSVLIQAPLVVDKDKSYPVVFAFHGRGGKNTSWVNSLKEFTNAGTFVGVYPQGHLNSWNLGPEPSTADDVAFVEAIVNRLQDISNLNLDRVFAVGTSNGAGMVNLLGAETTHFKAIAPVVSQLITSIVLTQQTKPLSIFQVNGAADNSIPIEGGNKFGHTFLSALESAEKWANQFGCNSTPTIETVGENTTYSFGNCTNSVQINYLRVEQGGHNIIASYPNLWNEMWQFFQSL